MAKKKIPKAKVVPVKAHPLKVPISKNNPTGTTIRDAHTRHINSLGINELKKIEAEYDKNKIKYPAKGKLLDYPTADNYDELIAVWCDYYNKLFPSTSPNDTLDPNIVKALIASESDFRLDPKNPKAIGIAQITPSTWKIIQDSKGELKDHLFKEIRQKDLKDPTVAIPVATRWLFQKKKLAENKLKRAPTPEEIILEYKGLLKSNSKFKDSAVEKFRGAYDKLSQ